MPRASPRFSGGRGVGLRLAALWLVVLAAAIMATLGDFGRGTLIGLVLLASWASAITLGSGRALRAALRVGSLLDRVRSWRLATRALLAIAMGIGTFILAKLSAR